MPKFYSGGYATLRKSTKKSGAADDRIKTTGNYLYAWLASGDKRARLTPQRFILHDSHPLPSTPRPLKEKIEEKTIEKFKANPLTLLAATLSVTFVLALSACNNPEKDDLSGIYLDNAYIKTVIPGRSMTAAYATIRNNDPETLCFVHFAAPFAQAIELHNTVAVGTEAEGRVKMERLQELCLAPGQAAELQPGGMHLMVMGVERLTSGAETTVPITLVTRGGRAFQAQFNLQPFTQ